MSFLTNFPLNPGLRIIPVRALAERLEPDTFSGGVNLSARERNRERKASEYRSVFSDDFRVFCAPRVFRELADELAGPAEKGEL